MAVTYLICAAGDGTRFRATLPSTPKPLIRMKGKTMLEWSLASLPILSKDHLIIITKKDHQVQSQLEDTIRGNYPFSKLSWLEIDKTTKGQLDTALLAKPYLQLKNSLCIYNCDSFFQSKTLLRLIEDQNIEGIIPCSKEPGTAWSFCKIDRYGQVREVKEKIRISPWATVGLYYFRSTSLFLQYALEELSQEIAGEYYVAPLYDRYIKNGYKVVIDRLHLFKPMGTPEQLQKYWNISTAKLIEENSAKKTILVDIDNTITIENPSDPYSQKKPNLPLIHKLQEYHDNGYEIILFTARRMKTHQHNEAKVIRDIGYVTLTWLKKTQGSL